jgi:hypothetical protein
MKLKIYILIVFLINIYKIEAQQDIKIIPPSPNASSLGIYGDIQTSKYTGTPEISIPIYTVKCGDISLPITLDYHASGIKVSQQASWVGLGWSLNAGGVITRTIFGYDDFGKRSKGWGDVPESPIGYYFDQDFPYVNSLNEIVPPINGNPDDDIYYNYNKIAASDGEPDVFCFNFNGYSGKFYFDRKRLNQNEYAVPVFSTKCDLSIKYFPSYNEDVDNDGGQSYGRWEIIDGKGYKYFFKTVETSTTNYGECNTYCNCYGSWPKPVQPDVVSSWYIDRIESPKGDFINFTYNTDARWIVNQNNFNESVIYRLGYDNIGGVIINNSLSQIISHEIYLTEINFNNGKVVLRTSDRNDLETKQISSKAQRLDSITIYNNQEKLLSCGFKYNYFGSFQDPNNSRLKLEKLNFIDSNGKNSFPYIFDYYSPQAMPLKTSNAIDHWGFFNGKGNAIQWGSDSYGNALSCDKGTLIPGTEAIDYNGNKKIYFGADRDPDANYMTNYMLNKITYPTGGYTEFTFEPHTYSNFAPYSTSNYETKRAGSQSTNINDYRYDTFTINEEQDVDLNYGFIDDKIEGVAWIDGHSEFESYLDGMYAQVSKINTTEPIECFSTVADQHDGGSLETYQNKTWNYSNSKRIHLQKGDYKIQVFNLSRHNIEVPENALNNFISIRYKASETLINTKIGGGVRVKKITNICGNNKQVKIFNYDSDSNLSSGKLLISHPIYSGLMNIDYEYIAGLNGDVPYYRIETGNFMVGMSNAMVNMYSGNGNVVGYDKVTEMIDESGQFGKNIYYYNNEIDVSSNSYGQKLWYVPGVGNSTTLQPITFSLTPVVPNLFALNNGLMTKMESYDKDGNLVLKKELNYSKNNQFDASIKGIRMDKIFSSSVSYNLKFYDRKCEWWKLDDITTTNYYGSNVLSTKNIYEYNLVNLLQNKETIIESNGKTSQKQITFPCDISDNSTYKGMTDKNMIEYPLETREYIDGKLTKGEINTFNFSNNTYLPYEKYQVETNIPLASFHVFDGNKDSKYPTFPQFKYNVYGSKGKINEIIQKDGTSVVYLWGYYNEFPIAEIKNATLMDVSNALTGITPEQLASLIVPDETKLESLRQRPSLSKAMITTYMYKPLVGITKTTDPRGVTTYYEYDTFNRLKQTYIVENGEKKILQKYDYHFQNQ